ncbi:hypothetical protein CMO96_03640, partial [Candidatus Woesebacteria bacterium]|nr:hypothetical protein [Candidatus Woesebacteria bacterium]
MTLTQTAFYTRRIIKYAVFFLVFLIAVRVTWSASSSIYKRLFPPPPPSPTVDFGRLPTLSVPQKQDLPQFSYALETTTGELPTLSTVA